MPPVVNQHIAVHVEMFNGQHSLLPMAVITNLIGILVVALHTRETVTSDAIITAESVEVSAHGRHADTAATDTHGRH